MGAPAQPSPFTVYNPLRINAPIKEGRGDTPRCIQCDRWLEPTSSGKRFCPACGYVFNCCD